MMLFWVRARARASCNTKSNYTPVRRFVCVSLNWTGLWCGIDLWSTKFNHTLFAEAPFTLPTHLFKRFHCLRCQYVVYNFPRLVDWRGPLKQNNFITVTCKIQGVRPLVAQSCRDCWLLTYVDITRWPAAVYVNI